MKVNKTLVIIPILITLFLTSCSSKYERNKKFAYGSLGGVDIDSIYPLSEEPSTSAYADFSDGVSHGQKGTYIIYSAETQSGGVVAYGKGMYVYSPDKEDKTAVENALLKECMERNIKNK